MYPEMPKFKRKLGLFGAFLRLFHSVLRRALSELKIVNKYVHGATFSQVWVGLVQVFSGDLHAHTFAGGAFSVPGFPGFTALISQRTAKKGRNLRNLVSAPVRITVAGI